MGILYPYQTQIANNPARLQIYNKSRQIGLSSVIAYIAIMLCLFENQNVLLVSSSQRQANNLMSYVENYLSKVFAKYGLKLKKDTQTQKIFPNGKSIHSLPAKPETIRGYAGTIILDEYGITKEDNKIYEALLPSLSTNKDYKLIICSTPLGCSNMFYEIYTNSNNRYPDFYRQEINCHEAIKQGCKLDIDMIRANMDEESFRQEYLCEFIDESTSFFPYDLLKSCITESTQEVKGKSCMGIDIGRTNDKTGIAITAEEKGNYYLKQLDTLTDKDFDTQKFHIKQLFQQYGIAKAMQDKGSIGYQLSEELEKELMNYIGVFTNQVQFMTDAVTFTKKLMEQGKFKFEENRDLINDFHKIKKVITPSNNTTFQIERDKSGHGDRAIAVILANYCFKENALPDIC